MKDLQKLNGLDDDYDNDSGSGPHNVGRRKTIHNLEKAKQKKRNIGTLDVAFKKRFFNMNANDGPGKLTHPHIFDTHIEKVMHRLQVFKLHIDESCSVALEATSE